MSSQMCTCVIFKLSGGKLSPLHFSTSKHIFFLQRSFHSRIFIMDSEFTTLANYRIITKSLLHTPQVHLKFIAGFWTSFYEPNTLAFLTFVLKPRASKDDLQAHNLLFRSPKLLPLVRRSSALRISQGH